MKHTANMIRKNSEESRELFLYAVNESRIYHNMIQPIITNLTRKVIKGVYNRDKAIDAYYYAACEAAKLYNKEFCSFDYNPFFDVTARYTVACEMEEYYRDEIRYNLKSIKGNKSLCLFP